VADVVGIIFPNGTKTYFFDPAGLELARGDRVVVQTANGPEIGQVVEPTHTIDDSELPAPLKKVTRLATGKDLEAQAAAQDLRKQAMATCRDMIAAHGLDMKLVGADISFGGEKITFSFYADERVDFRSLVADLAKALKTRIELRQVGAREEARMVGGLGPCGRSLCCTLFPPGDEPVSIRMAKEQNLPLNPAKISGLCGRLMCCLKYEQDQYVRFRKEAPAKGTPVSTPGGEGVIVGYNVLKDAITVRLEDGHSTDIKICSCQCQADGGLLVVPELGEPAEPVDLAASLSAIEGLAVNDAVAAAVAATADTGEEELAIVEAEVVLGANGEPVEVIVAETSRRSRSRRGRGRRGGRNRARATADDARPSGEGAPAGVAGTAGVGSAGTFDGAGGSGADGATGAPAGGQTPAGSSRRHGHRQVRHPERHRSGGAPGTPGGSAGDQGGGGPAGNSDVAGGTGSSTRSRRRRRPRRPGGGETGSPGGGSAGTSGSGSAAGSGPGPRPGDAGGSN
jgi:cell fate regulator YaaT (PSP1 superfamily)